MPPTATETSPKAAGHLDSIERRDVCALLGSVNADPLLSNENAYPLTHFACALLSNENADPLAHFDYDHANDFFTKTF